MCFCQMENSAQNMGKRVCEGDRAGHRSLFNSKRITQHSIDVANDVMGLYYFQCLSGMSRINNSSSEC